MKYIKLSSVIESAKCRRCGDNEYPVLSITKDDGIVLQSEKFKKRIASQDTAQYKVVCRGQLVQGIHIDEANFGIQDIVDEGIVSPAYKIWDVDTTVMIGQFLAEVLRSPRSIQYYSSNFNGSVKRRERLSDKDFLAMEIPCPSLQEQHHILDIIEKARAVISDRQCELQKLDELIKARFVEMFGDPATNPRGWVETTVGAECFYIKDGPHKSLPDIGKENGGHPFISVRNIVNHTIDFSTARYISDEDYADAIKKCHPEKGDMLYSKGGTTGIAKLIDIDDEFANWVHVAVLKFYKDKLNGIFFENMLNSDYCYDQSQKLTKGIANRDLVLSAMAQIKMYRPPMELQEQFASFVKQVDKSKVAVQAALDKAQLLFDSLMQEYFG